MILCFYRQDAENYKEKHKIIDVPFFFPLAVQNKWPKGMRVGAENSSGKDVWSTGVWSTLWKMC